MENTKKYIIITSIIIVILVIIFKLFFIFSEKKTHYDKREETCNWKTIKSVEYNIDEKKCFEINISACQKPSFTSIKECEKLNGIK